MVFSEGNTSLKLYRDSKRTVRILEDNSGTYIIAGLEDSSYIDYAAPVRSLVYDALDYYAQMKEQRKNKRHKNAGEFMSIFPKDGKLKTVHTVFVYWGTKRWDGPRSLKEMIDPEYIRKFGPLFNDYRLTLILAYEIEDSIIFSLKSSLREVFAFLKAANGSMDQMFRVMHLWKFRKDRISLQTAILLDHVTNSKLLSKECSQNEPGGKQMCRAVDEMRAAIKTAEQSALKYQKKSEKFEQIAAVNAQKAEINAQRASEAEKRLAEERLHADQLEAKVRRMTETLRALGVSDEELKLLA